MTMQEKIQAFDSFIVLYKVLVRVGFYRLAPKPDHKMQAFLHRFYRILVFILTILYNVSHCVFIVQHFQDKDQVFQCLIIEIPQITLVAKQLSIISGANKLDRLREIMYDPIFAPNNEEDEQCLRRHRDMLRRITKITYFGTTTASLLWGLSSIIKRLKNENYIIANYFPFETMGWGRFLLAALLEHFLVFPWLIISHVTLDLLIAFHYSQACVQLKIIRFNLETLCNSLNDPIVNSSIINNNLQYIDHRDPKVKERFIHIIKRYEKVVWFIKEVNEIFYSAISFQLFTTITLICLIIFKMTNDSKTSLEFSHLILYFVILQMQVFVFCFFGEIVKYESQFVVDSMYLSDWMSLSPSFRRMMLIAMTRWTVPIEPRVLIVVPLSLKTFILVVRAGFNLFTVLLNSTKSLN